VKAYSLRNALKDLIKCTIFFNNKMGREIAGLRRYPLRLRNGLFTQNFDPLNSLKLKEKMVL
jgi:hypothetical protein